MEIGRNHPCPCGSGKKYKKCCLGNAAAPSVDFYYRRLCEAHDRLVKRLGVYAGREFGEQTVQAAMHEFFLWPDDEEHFSEETLERAGPLFWPWFLFNWEYDPDDSDVELAVPPGRTMAELFAQDRTRRIDALEERLLKSVNRKPYTFWEVLSVEAGKGMTLQDILTGARVAVEERSGSHHVEAGDVLFGRAVTVDGVGMLMGLSRTLIPPGRKPAVIELRKRLRRRRTAVTDDTLQEWDAEIRELYFQLDHELHAPPQVCNTDGHELEFHRLVYAVDDAEAAFEKLCGLCVTCTADELRAEAQRDGAGRISRVEFPWDRRGHTQTAAMPNTVLGRITIDGRRLTAEVNSAERAAQLRRELDARLEKSGRFQVDEIQDLEAAMARHAGGAAEKRAASKQADLMRSPEVREKIAEIMDKHWEGWMDQGIPALGGKTPREAVRTPDGREAVEALLKDVERGRRGDPLITEMNRRGAERARAILGLKPRG
jgi:hypothetical protein